MAAFPQRRGSRDRGKERLQWGVRRDKGAFQWVQAPPGDSLQPEAIGAVMEVTKWLKPSISVSRIGDSECAGRNASERRACLEKVDVQADPTAESGKADTVGEMSEEYAQPLHRGSDGSMYTRKARATRETPRRGHG